MYTIGIDVSGESVKFGVIGRNIEPVWRSEISFEPGDPEAMLIKIADCVREAGERYPLSRVGVSCAGSVDLETGRVWGDEIEFDIFDENDIGYVCDCSRERTRRALFSLPQKDIDEMIADGETIEMTCRFCDNIYKFDIDELKKIREEQNDR